MALLNFSLTHLASSLSEDELQKVQAHYAQLKSLSAASTELRLASNASTQNYHATLQPLNRAEALGKSVLEIGNPLAGKS